MADAQVGLSDKIIVPNRADFKLDRESVSKATHFPKRQSPWSVTPSPAREVSDV